VYTEDGALVLKLEPICRDYEIEKVGHPLNTTYTIGSAALDLDIRTFESAAEDQNCWETNVFVIGGQP